MHEKCLKIVVCKVNFAKWNYPGANYLDGDCEWFFSNVAKKQKCCVEVG